MKFTLIHQAKTGILLVNHLSGKELEAFITDYVSDDVEADGATLFLIESEVGADCYVYTSNNLPCVIVRTA